MSYHRNEANCKLHDKISLNSIELALSLKFLLTINSKQMSILNKLFSLFKIMKQIKKKVKVLGFVNY